MRRTLTIPLKAGYFNAIKAGEKREEFRLRTPYWRRRLERMQPGDMLVLTLGYPDRSDANKRLTLPWRGMRETTITHPHFGPDPVEVFAIDVQGIQEAEWPASSR